MSQLKIEIHSFSYKKGGIPKDTSGNGGGFCFDCRGILNPGRIEEFKPQNGKDQPVIEYLETQTEMPAFLQHIQQLVSITVKNYIERGFENLQINFGCTGGQHRSVYCAEKTAAYLKENFPETEISVHHDEQPQLNHQQ